jgi:hypothetical protein
MEILYRQRNPIQLAFPHSKSWIKTGLTRPGTFKSAWRKSPDRDFKNRQITFGSVDSGQIDRFAEIGNFEGV